MSIRLNRPEHQVQPVNHHAQRRPSRAQHAHNLELLLPRGPHPPGQRDGHDKDDKVGGDGDAEVGEEDLALAEAVAADARVPVGVDGVADDDLDDLEGDVGEGEDDDEGVDGVGDARLDVEDAGDEQEEGDFGEEGGWAVYKRVDVKPLAMC